METRQVLSFFFPPASVLASQIVITFQGENDTATIYADFYMRSPRQLNSLGAKAQEKKSPRRESWSKPLYRRQIVGIKPEM